MRSELAGQLRVPRHWTGRLRRTALARAIQGSNSIEGYRVELDDADASLDDEEPMTADQRTFAEIRGYRQALGYVLAMAHDEHFALDASALRSMHYMMLSHDLSTSPGQYRQRDICVHDERTEQLVHNGPDPAVVPDLVDELVADLGREDAATLVPPWLPLRRPIPHTRLGIGRGPRVSAGHPCRSVVSQELW